MITDKDIRKIVAANTEAGREVFVTKEEFGDLRRDFNSLQSSIDNYARKADSYFEEMLLLNRRIDRLEKWVHQVAEKIGVRLE